MPIKKLHTKIIKRITRKESYKQINLEWMQNQKSSTKYYQIEINNIHFMLWGWHFTSVVFILRSHNHRIIRKASAKSWLSDMLANGWPLFFKSITVMQTEANLSNSHIQRSPKFQSSLYSAILKSTNFTSITFYRSSHSLISV